MTVREGLRPREGAGNPPSTQAPGPALRSPRQRRLGGAKRPQPPGREPSRRYGELRKPTVQAHHNIRRRAHRRRAHAARPVQIQPHLRRNRRHRLRATLFADHNRLLAQSPSLCLFLSAQIGNLPALSVAFRVTNSEKALMPPEHRATTLRRPSTHLRPSSPS